MTHNVRTQSDATWTTGNYVTLQADWQSLGAKLFAAINGDRGGTWAPSSPIVLDGTAAPITFGTVLVDFGGSITIGASAIVQISGVTGGWPLFGAGHVNRTRTILHSWIERQSTPLYHWANNINAGGVQSIACTIRSTKLSITYDPGFGTYRPPTYVDVPIYNTFGSVQQPRMLLPLRVHDGARLASATVTFIVPSSRTASPATPPRLRILRADLSGTTVALASVASGADALGFRPIASPSSGAAWFAGGAVQSFTYACDQNHIVDVSQYVYYAELIEEAATPVAVASCDGTLFRERKSDVDVATTGNVTRSGAQTIDGVSVGAGANLLILVKDQSDFTQNGMYYAPSGGGTWTRLPGLTAPQDFTPGFLVRVSGGTTNAGTMWECSGPTSSGTVTVADGTGSPITFQRRKPRGNIYLGLAVVFDSIFDMRWQ